MKQCLIFLTLTLFLCPILAQPPGEGPGRNARKKLEELEKLKLIETLNMNEDVTIRFFARRNEHRKKMREINERIDSLFDATEEALNSGKSVQGRKFIEEASKLEATVIKERQNFINSLSDILSDEQLAKLVVFERNFRRNVQELMLKRGAGRNKPPVNED